jgi:hypothetical protein
LQKIQNLKQKKTQKKKINWVVEEPKQETVSISKKDKKDDFFDDVLGGDES